MRIDLGNFLGRAFPHLPVSFGCFLVRRCALHNFKADEFFSEPVAILPSSASPFPHPALAKHCLLKLDSHGRNHSRTAPCEKIAPFIVSGGYRIDSVV